MKTVDHAIDGLIALLVWRVQNQMKPVSAAVIDQRDRFRSRISPTRLMFRIVRAGLSRKRAIMILCELSNSLC